jgi:hypothetical protein
MMCSGPPAAEALFARICDRLDETAKGEAAGHDEATVQV